MLWRLPRTFETTPVRCASCSAVRPTMPGSAPSTMYCWPAVNSVRNRASNFSGVLLDAWLLDDPSGDVRERSDAALILRPLLRLRDAGLAVLGVVVGVQPVLRHEDQVTLVIGDAFEAEGVRDAAPAPTVAAVVKHRMWAQRASWSCVSCPRLRFVPIVCLHRNV